MNQDVTLTGKPERIYIPLPPDLQYIRQGNRAYVTTVDNDFIHTPVVIKYDAATGVFETEYAVYKPLPFPQRPPS